MKLKSHALDIITVCYNNLYGLTKTYKSLSGQINNDIRWIIVDGNSTDGTKDFLINLKSKYIKIISENDKGIYDAMNKGISISNGEYLFFLNSGDTLLTNLSSCVIKKLTSDVNVFNIKIADENDNILIKKKLSTNPNSLFFFPSIPHQSAFIRRSLFLKFGLYDLDFLLLADYEKFCKFLKNKVNFSFYDDIDVSIFNNDGLTSNFSNYNNLFNEIKIIQTKYFYKYSIRMTLVYKTKFFLFKIFRIKNLNVLRKVLQKFKNVHISNITNLQL
mgnify:CR=1 FL=1